jgi:transcriptional repressor NrdR
MRCPFCSNEDTQVKDSRPTEDNTSIRRRRVCDQCGSRFTTFERIQLRDLVVIKSKGQKENFDRDKKIEKIVNAIVRKLENSGETEVKSNIIGQYIMEALMHLDQVAYVRFASVYKNFREAKDFEDFLGNLEDK